MAQGGTPGLCTSSPSSSGVLRFAERLLLVARVAEQPQVAERVIITASLVVDLAGNGAGTTVLTRPTIPLANLSSELRPVRRQSSSTITRRPRLALMNRAWRQVRAGRLRTWR